MTAVGRGFRPNDYSAAFFAMADKLMEDRATNASYVSRNAGKSDGWLRQHYHRGRPWAPGVINTFAKALALSPRDTIELHYLSAKALGFTVGRHQL